jgi:hypothetical protein
MLTLAPSAGSVAPEAPAAARPEGGGAARLKGLTPASRELPSGTWGSASGMTSVRSSAAGAQAAGCAKGEVERPNAACKYSGSMERIIL